MSEGHREWAWCSLILVYVGVMDSHQTDRIHISQVTVLTTKPFKTLPSPHASKETKKSAVFPLAERPLLWRKHLLWPRVSALKTVVQFRDTQSSFKEIRSRIARNYSHIKFYCNKCTSIKICLSGHTVPHNLNSVWVWVFRYAIGPIFLF